MKRQVFWVFFLLLIGMLLVNASAEELAPPLPEIEDVSSLELNSDTTAWTQEPVDSKVDTLTQQDSVAPDGEEAPLGILSAHRLVLTPDAVVSLLTQNNLDVALAAAQRDEVKGYYYQALSQLLPSVQGFLSKEDFKGGEIYYLQTPVSIDRVTWQPRLSVTYTVPLGGKTLFDLSAARHTVKRATWSQSAVLQQNLLDAFTAYLNILYTAEAMEIANQSLKFAEAQVLFHQNRVDTGFGTRLEVEQARTEVAKRQVECIQIDNERSEAQTKLSTLLNLPIDTIANADNRLLVPFQLLTPQTTLVQLYANALAHRPDLKGIQEELAANQAKIKSAWSDLLPTVTVSAYQRGVGPKLDQLDESHQTYASVSVDVLRNMGVLNFSQIKIQQARYKESLIQKEKQLTAVRQALSNALQDYRTAEAEMRQAESQGASALEAAKLAAARLKTGMGINIDLIEAENNVRLARLGYKKAILNFNLAQLRVLAESGMLIPDQVASAFNRIQLISDRQP